MFTSFVKAEEKKYINQKKEKGYFLSKCAKYYKTYSLQQNRTKYFIKVKLLTSPFFTWVIYVTPVTKKTFS